MLLLLARSIGVIGGGMVEEEMHGEWMVAAAGHAAAARTGGIGIIASLLLLRGRRHTLYAFVTLDPPLDPVAGLASPREPCRGGFTTRLFAFALPCAAPPSPPGARPVLSQTS